MNNRVWGTLLTVALVLVLVQSARSQVRGTVVYSRIFTPNAPASVEYSSSAPGDIAFTLERVENETDALLTVKDWRSPVLPTGTRTTVVRRFGRDAVKGEWNYGTLQLGVLPEGVYAVRAEQNKTTSSALVIVSKLALVLKTSPAQTLAWTVDALNGAPLAARVYRAGGATSSLGDGSGLARLPYDKDASVYLARFGDSWALAGAGMATWNVRQSYGYAYTERPVYRPGDEVFVKGILRDAKSLKARANTAVRVRVLHQESGSEVYRGTATTNNFGSFALSLNLNARARTGQYVVNVTGEGSDAFNGLFKVEAYQKPEFSVTVSLPQKAVQGERVTAKVSAAYLFGGKVANARVNYTVTRSRVYDWWWYASQEDQAEARAQQKLVSYEQGYDYGDGYWWQPPAQTIISERGRLDAQGELSIPLPLSKNAEGASDTYTVTANVEDETRQVVAGGDTVTAAPASRSVRVRTNGYGYNVGEPIALEVETLDLQERGVADTVKLEVVREVWDSERSVTRPVQTLEVNTDAKGQGRANFRAPSSGYYRVNATVSDDQGRVAKAQWWVWVVGSESEVWSYRFDELKITLDKARYAPGETVTAFIQNPRPGASVLVTVERDGVEGVRILRGRAPVLRYSFRATTAQTPNVFLSATMVSGGRVYSSEARVRIDNPQRALLVGIKPAKARFAPGETTTLRVQTTDSSGKGVPAELGVSVVDEGVYLVRADEAPDITEFFHRPRANAVGTQYSTNWYFQGIPRPAAPLAQAAPATAATENMADASSRARSPDEPRVRQDFKDTALWRAQVVTDAQGSADLELKFPDNLTTWRVTAKGIAQSGSAGEARRGVLVTQDIVARLGVPRTLVRGDTTQVSLVVNNNLASSTTANLELRANGLRATNATKSETNVGAGGRGTLRVNLTAGSVGTATLLGRALTPSASDALEIPVTVRARGFVERRAFSSDTRGGAQTLNVAADSSPDTRRLSVLVTPSLTAAVSPALEYLLGYPYGCTEQTMSRFLPALLASKTLKQLELDEKTVKQLPEYIKNGIERLENFQHGDGGWGFWEYDDSTLEMSAYVMGGLLRAKALGSRVDASTLERGLKFLQTAVNQERHSREDRAGAYLTLAIAAQAPVEAMRRFAAQDALTPSVLAKLAIAFSRADADRDAQDALERLVAKRQETARGVSWRNPDDARSRWWWSWDDNPVTTTAVALEALARVQPNSPLIPKVAAWLLTERQGARWVSTRDTAAVIEAALSLNEPASNQAVAVDVLVNGVGVKTVSVTKQTTLEWMGADVPLKNGANTLELRADARLIYSADLEYTREPVQLTSASNGITVTRTYQKLEAQFKDNQYSFTPQPLSRNGTLEPVTVGEYVLVTLKVQAEDARYLLLSDGIPAGFKALETRAIPLAGTRFQYPWEWGWNYWFSGLDIRDDRVDVYASNLDGAQTVQYVLRAETPGRYTALPTSAFLMYEPTVNGRSSGATFTVRDRGQ
jgi:hypothetical protein